MHINARHYGHVPIYSCYAETQNLQDPRRISSSNIIVSIADHKHIFFAWGITLKNHQSLLCEIYGNKSYETAFLCEHIIILYLLCVEIIIYNAQLYIRVQKYSILIEPALVLFLPSNCTHMLAHSEIVPARTIQGNTVANSTKSTLHVRSQQVDKNEASLQLSAATSHIASLWPDE